MKRAGRTVVAAEPVEVEHPYFTETELHKAVAQGEESPYVDAKCAPGVGSVQDQKLDFASPLLPAFCRLQHLDFSVPLHDQDLRQYRLGAGADLLGDEGAVEEEMAAFKVEGGRVVERCGKFEDAKEEFGREAVEHGRRRRE